MSGVMYLGNQMVSPVILHGLKMISGREITQDGKFQVQTSVVTLPEEIKDVGDRAFQYYCNEKPIAGLSVPYLEKVTGDYAFARSFVSSLKNTTVVFEKLETVSGYAAFSKTFANCEGLILNFNALKNINGDYCFVQIGQGDPTGYERMHGVSEFYMNEVEEIDGAYTFSSAFSGNDSFTVFELNKLKKIKSTNFSMFGNTFYNSTGLLNFSLPSLEEIEDTDSFSLLKNAPFKDAFSNNTNLRSISFPKLKIVGKSGLRHITTSAAPFPNLSIFDVSAVETAREAAFASCFNEGNFTELKYISFDSLKNIQSELVFSSFAPNSLKTLIFKALDENSFGNYTNQFNGMLSRTTNCVVYFPSSLESVIGNWSSVLAGFGGTNTTIVFVIPMTLTLNITPDTTNILYNGVKEDNKLMIVQNVSRFILQNESEYKNVLYTYNGFVEDTEETLNIDMNDYTYIKVTVNVGSSYPDSKLIWNNLEIPMIEESEGIYSCYINDVVGETLLFKNDGGSSDYTFTQEFQTTGEDITLTVTPTPKETRSFSRPNLTSNGTLGGEAFAVNADTNTSNAYRAVDSSTSSYWSGGYSNSQYVIYNPSQLKINSFTFTWYSASYRATSIVLQGSNDGLEWDELGTYTTSSSATYTLTPSVSGFYKYYRLSLTPYGWNNPEIKNIVINALEVIP